MNAVEEGELWGPSIMLVRMSVTSASMEISMSSFRKLKHKLHFGLDMLLLNCMQMNQSEYNSSIYIPMFLKVHCSDQYIESV